MILTRIVPKVMLIQEVISFYYPENAAHVEEVNIPIWNKQLAIYRICLFLIDNAKAYCRYEIQDINNKFSSAEKLRIFIIDKSLNIESNKQGVTEFSLTVNSPK